jgi:hypothetical protein
MASTTKWLVSFTTPASKGMFLKETIEATHWNYAKAILESKYQDVKVMSYTIVR